VYTTNWSGRPGMVISSVIMALPAGLLLLLNWMKGAPHFRSMQLAVLLEARLQRVGLLLMQRHDRKYSSSTIRN
jgi:hypothetical protein